MDNNRVQPLRKSIKEEICFKTFLDIKQECEESTELQINIPTNQDTFTSINNNQLSPLKNEKEENYLLEIKQEPCEYTLQTDIVVKQEELSANEDSTFSISAPIKEGICFKTTLDIKHECEEFAELQNDIPTNQYTFLSTNNNQLSPLICKKEENYLLDIKQECCEYTLHTDRVVKQEELNADNDSFFPTLVVKEENYCMTEKERLKVLMIKKDYCADNENQLSVYHGINYSMKIGTNKANKNQFNIIKNLKGKKSFECNICKEQFWLMSCLVYHFTNNHGVIKPFKCKVCTKTFAKKFHLSNHMKTHTSEKLIVCSICTKMFSSKGYLVRHLRIHTDKFYECKICKMRFKSLSSLYNHQRKNYKPDKLFECDMCNRKFYQKSHLTAHIRNHFGERPFQCNICKLTFSAESTLTYHTKCTHLNLQNYVCNVCSKKFSHKSHYFSHIKTHTGERPFQCQICKKNFVRKSHLTRHFITHTREKLFECKFCGKKSSYKSVTTRHEKTHAREVFKCTLCKMTFIEISLLIIHAKNHSSSITEPYQCNVCNKMFDNHLFLTKHIKTHSKRLLYECAICYSHYSSKGSLNKHLKTHNNENYQNK